MKKNVFLIHSPPPSVINANDQAELGKRVWPTNHHKNSTTLGGHSSISPWLYISVIFSCFRESITILYPQAPRSHMVAKKLPQVFKKKIRLIIQLGKCLSSLLSVLIPATGRRQGPGTTPSAPCCNLDHLCPFVSLHLSITLLLLCVKICNRKYFSLNSEPPWCLPWPGHGREKTRFTAEPQKQPQRARSLEDRPKPGFTPRS